jgi:uncharacterized protein DUF642/PEP-CTERM motif-containing protein
MRRTLLGLIALGTLSAVTWQRALGGNIVVNGGFETPVVTDFYFDTYSAGQSFTGWTVGQGSVALYTDQYNPALSDVPYQGNQALQLNTQGGNGSIYQDLVTTPGTTYELSIAFASNPFASGSGSMDVAWGSATVASLSAAPSHDFTNLGWVVESYTVTATQGITRLEFSNTTSVAGVGLPQIDAVIVSAVPEPSSLVMGFIGMTALGGVVLVRRRSRR